MSEEQEVVEQHANKAMLQEVMGLVRLAAEHKMWNQGDWLTQDEYTLNGATPVVYKGQEFCGTAGCFAGWAVMLDGWKPMTQENPWGEPELVIEKDGHRKPAWQTSYIARKLLGLNDTDSEVLFEGFNTLEDLECHVKRFCAGETYANDPEYAEYEDDDE